MLFCPANNGHGTIRHCDAFQAETSCGWANGTGIGLLNGRCDSVFQSGWDRHWTEIGIGDINQYLTLGVHTGSNNDLYVYLEVALCGSSVNLNLAVAQVYLRIS